MTGTVGIIGGKDKQIEDLVRATGMRPVVLQADQLASASRSLASMPDVVLVDVRVDRPLLASVAAIKRRYPTIGIAIVVPSLEPELMLEAMRAGVTEVLVEPLTAESLRTSLERIVVPK